MVDHVEHVGTLRDGRNVVRAVFAVEPFAVKSGEGDAATSADWIQIMPFGPLVAARDGRSFIVSSLASVVQQTELPLLVDWEHRSEWGDTEAAGWVEELAIETAQDGSGKFPRPGLWGRVSWTDKGKVDVASKAYRFLSPSLLLSHDTQDAQQVLAVALTNRPALNMEGIGKYRMALSARVGPWASSEETNSMTPEQRKALCAKLGLPETATDAQILEQTDAFAARGTQSATELAAVKAENERLKQAEQAATTARFHADVDALIERAVTVDKKLTPAQRDAWATFCKASKDNFESFRDKLLPGMVPLVSSTPSAPGAGTPPSTSTYGATGEQIPAGMDPQAYADCRERGMSHKSIVDTFAYTQKQAAKFGTQPLSAE